MSDNQQREVPFAIRAAVGSGRQRECTLATDQRVRVFDRRSGGVIEEILLIDGASFRDPAPMQIDHDRGIPSMVGSVTNFRRDPGKLVGTLRFAEGVHQADEAWSLVQQGHLRSVSVGYAVLRSEEIPAGRTRTISGRTFTAGNGPLRVVTMWMLKEVSLVSQPADSAATIRSMRSEMPNTQTADGHIVAIPSHELDNMRLADYAKVLLKSRGEVVSEDAGTNSRSAFEGTGELTSVVTTWVQDGWRSGEDCLSGIVKTIDAPNYLQNELAAITVHPRMQSIARGGIAPEASMAAGSQNYRLLRFGLQFSLDETDMIDGARLGVMGQAVTEAMRAARSLVADLQWSVLLGNPTELRCFTSIGATSPRLHLRRLRWILVSAWLAARRAWTPTINRSTETWRPDTWSCLRPSKARLIDSPAT